MAAEIKSTHQQYNICGMAKERFICLSTSLSASHQFYFAVVDVKDCKDARTNQKYLFEFHVVDARGNIRDFDFDRDGPETYFYIFNPRDGGGRYLRRSRDREDSKDYYVETCVSREEAHKCRFVATHGAKEAGFLQFEDGFILFTNNTAKTEDSKLHLEARHNEEVEGRSRFLLIPVGPNKKLERSLAAEKERLVREKDAEISQVKEEAKKSADDRISAAVTAEKEKDIEITQLKAELKLARESVSVLEKEKAELLAKTPAAHSSTFVQTDVRPAVPTAASSTNSSSGALLATSMTQGVLNSGSPSQSQKASTTTRDVSASDGVAVVASTNVKARADILKKDVDGDDNSQCCTNISCTIL